LGLNTRRAGASGASTEVAMKKNALTTALLAGLAGAAGLACTVHAANLNPDGLGQALVYPYYTVNGSDRVVTPIDELMYVPGEGLFVTAWERAADSERFVRTEYVTADTRSYQPFRGYQTPPGKPG
jgi:hypothetical protein